MKIKSLILGSVAAAGLSTGAMAADLGTVLTNLDVCDALGVSGLTISSDTNCLQITGGVSYDFTWGNYNNTLHTARNLLVGSSTTIMTPGGIPGFELDWDSTVEAWLQFEASADSSFGTAMAVIKLEYGNSKSVVNEGLGSTTVLTGSVMTVTVGAIDEAYVSVGDSTVLMAGQKGTIANFDNEDPFNYLGLFNDSIVGGVSGNTAFLGTGGHVIQVTSDLGDGFSVAAGLENINSGSALGDGTAVGVIAYDGDTVDANLTVLAGGVLDGTIENWGVQAGITADLDMFRIRGAIAADNTGYWNALGSAEAEFDMFTLAVSGEAGASVVGLFVGVGGSISADVTDTVTINLGARWFDEDTGTFPAETSWEIAGQLIAEVTETITLTGELGYVADSAPAVHSDIYFGGDIAWAPGGGFEASVGAEANTTGAYQVSFSASKDFE